jgi:hypothetical protein
MLRVVHDSPWDLPRYEMMYQLGKSILLFSYILSLMFLAVHYRAWTEMTMHKFEDTFREGQPMELILGQGMNCGSGLSYIFGKSVVVFLH